MLSEAFPSWPCFTREEADAVADVLKSNRVNYWTGQEGRKFEADFASWCGVEHAVAVMNGTVALEAILRALDIGVGDEVVVTPRTFIASASCVIMTGAKPIFADVDADSQNITAQSIGEVITRRTKAIICVHLAGWPCEMDEIGALAAEHELTVIEDCAQAHGARYRGRPVGSLGHGAAWSFCQDKIMTTGGEGGMITTASDTLWRRAWSYKDHGKSYAAVHREDHPPGFRWLHESFGTNLRMLEVQAAIGRIQLTRMADWHLARKSNASQVLDECRRCPALFVPDVPAHIDHAWYRAYAFVRPEALRSAWTRDRILSEIVAEGVPCATGSCSEVYLERAFDAPGLRPERRLPVAQRLGEESLAFLVHPTLGPPHIERIRQVIRRVMDRATR